jgi:murein DD-endopeptidase MepM/ murein hydrolase activator NlpD
MNSNIFKNKKNGSIKYLMILILFGVLGLTSFILFSYQFEQNKPEILVKDKIYWNFKTKLNIKLTDESGIKYYKITYHDGDKSMQLNSEILSSINKEMIVEVSPPKLDMFYKSKNVYLEIEVVDNSIWNFFDGNKNIKKVNLIIDTKKPIASVINNTRYIRRGGSALVVVKVEDMNLKEAYISFNEKIKFKLIPFYKENYFISLIAWDVNIEKFHRVNLIAIDYAKNKTITKIPLYIKKLKIKKDTINLSTKFIEEVSRDVLKQSGKKISIDLKQRFIDQNKLLRAKNIAFLKILSIVKMDMSKIDNFYIKIFRRLRGSRTAANFGEKRLYYYDNKKIDEAWHLGIDWASVKMATIQTSNKGVVILNQYLGIYGNTIVIDHGMGLASLYAHISNSDVSIGERVSAKQKIANTGSTGAVLGDHLHFGILIQGTEVNPLEWMDKNWIKNNITKIILKAKKIIDKK